MRVLLLALLVVACVATFSCENEIVSHDEPTAIYTDRLMHVVNCTLIRTALWCIDCDMDVVNSTFVLAPRPAVGLYRTRSYTLSNNAFKLTTALRAVIVMPDALDMEEDSGLSHFMNARQSVIYIG